MLFTGFFAGAQSQMKHSDNNHRSLSNKARKTDESPRKDFVLTRDRLALWIWFCAFFGLLQTAYVVFVSPYFAYMGFALQFDVLEYVEGSLLFLAFIMFLPMRKDAPSSVLLSLYAALLLAPASVLYALGELHQTPVYLVFAAGMLLTVMSRLRMASPVRVRHADKIFLIICVMALVITIAWIPISGALRHFNLNPMEVYGQRAAVSDLIYRGPFSYLVPMTLKGFGIGLLVYFLWYRQKFLYVSLLVGFIFFYGATGHKSVFTIPILVTGVYLWQSRGSNLWQIPAFMTAIVAAALGASIILNNIYIASILIRRVFFVPAHFIGVYIEYFDEAGYKYFSTVIFSRILSGISEVPPQSEISVYLTGTRDIWYNAGFVATGYMHAGLLGVLIYTIVTGIIIVAVDSLARGGYSGPALALMIVPISILYTTADLVTTFLSHGLLTALFLLWLFRSGVDPGGRRGRR